ncbi:MAG: hypothetical protein ACTSYI_08680 [Promethearchaeota archaeon]
MVGCNILANLSFLTEKELLEKIQAKLVLLRGKKISQQEILGRCIRFSNHNFEQFVKEEFNSPKIIGDLIEKVISNTFKSGFHFPDKSEDKLIYGI